METHPKIVFEFQLNDLVKRYTTESIDLAFWISNLIEDDEMYPIYKIFFQFRTIADLTKVLDMMLQSPHYQFTSVIDHQSVIKENGIIPKLEYGEHNVLQVTDSEGYIENFTSSEEQFLTDVLNFKLIDSDITDWINLISYAPQYENTSIQEYYQLRLDDRNPLLETCDCYQKSYNIEGSDSEDYDSEDYDSEDYDSEGSDSEDYDSEDYDSEDYDSEDYDNENKYSEYQTTLEWEPVGEEPEDPEIYYDMYHGRYFSNDESDSYFDAYMTPSLEPDVTNNETPNDNFNFLHVLYNIPKKHDFNYIMIYDTSKETKKPEKQEPETPPPEYVESDDESIPPKDYLEQSVKPRPTKRSLRELIRIVYRKISKSRLSIKKLFTACW